MYNKLNITELHLRITALFTDGYNRQLYIREVAKLLKIAPRSAQLTLYDLEKKGVLEAVPKGKITLFQLKPSAEQYLCLAESYKKTSFLVKHSLFDTLRLDADVAIIFGSYAKGIEKKDSDLDIFIIGDYNKASAKDFEQTFGIRLDIKNYPKGSLKSTDFLIREVIKDHVILAGTETFVGSILSLKSLLDVD
ncbi:MAG: nucleotidyltransferase domain-containing protein [Candidatus Woesearchaeota archaeon]